jgi:hypothetical protein
VALILSLATGVGVWIVKEPVTVRTRQVFKRVEAAFDIAQQGLEHINTSLARATERLDTVKEEQRQLAQNPRGNNLLQRTLARTVQQKLAPDLGNANEKLHTVAEAAVVVNSILEDVGNVPFMSIPGLDLDGLTRLNNSLAAVGPAAWELSRLLGEPESDPEACRSQLSRIEQTLKTLRSSLAKFGGQFAQVRQRADLLKSRTLSWITPASVLISIICFWIALSQISLLVHARSWWNQAARPGRDKNLLPTRDGWSLGEPSQRQPGASTRPK